MGYLSHEVGNLVRLSTTVCAITLVTGPSMRATALSPERARSTSSPENRHRGSKIALAARGLMWSQRLKPRECIAHWSNRRKSRKNLPLALSKIILLLLS